MENTKFGFTGKFTTQPGMRDALAELLMEGMDALRSFEGCLLYVVSVSEDEPDTVWVTEAWTDAEAHAASLQLEEVKAQIAQARPMIAGIEGTKLRVLGGKGL